MVEDAEIVNDKPAAPQPPKQLDLLEAVHLVEQGLAKVGAYQEAMVLKSTRSYIEELRKQIAEKTKAPESAPAAEAAE